MKFLLVAVNAKYIHSNPAIYSLRAYAGEELLPYIDLAEYTINNYAQDIMADIYRRKPDAIGFSCYIWNWNIIQELLVELPKLLPQTDIWLGGPEVTYDAPDILKKYSSVTGIMIGEGEATFRELLCWYVEEERKWSAQAGGAVPKSDTQKRQQLFEKCAGLCLPNGYTAARELLDISELPFLYENLDSFANKIIYYETSRGCPYRCSYCLSSIDKRVRFRDISVVKRELQFFLDHKVSQVKFVDRTFNCNHEHAMEIWQYLYEHDNGVTNFHFEISADILREEEIALLRKLRPGLAQLEIGVQSTNPETISAIQRVMNVEHLEGIVAAIHQGQNIHQHLDLIAGLPYEDYASFAESFNRVYAMHPEQLQLGFLKVLKGSDMHAKVKEYGICYLDKPPYEVLYTKWLSYEEVLKLKAVEEMVELYYNSSQFTHTLPFMEKAFATPFQMYETLAAFYEEQGYFINSPARAYRYQVLLQFAEQYDKEKLPVYKELLTFDLYLRENLKSRPEFARNITEETVKTKIRNFYKQEELQRKYLPGYKDYDHKQLGKMTHLEPFSYPVWDVEQLLDAYKENGQRCNSQSAKEQKADVCMTKQKQYYVLFDYQVRNPLTYEAATFVIEEKVEEK